MTIAGLALLFGGGCGAKTGLRLAEAGPPRRDAGLDAAFDAGPPPPTPDFVARISADNAYGFGYGSREALRTYFNGREARVACEIFCCSLPCERDADCEVGTCDPFGVCDADGRGPESYAVAGPDLRLDDSLYIIAWSDDSVTQGVIGSFTAAGRAPVYTGDPAFEVCATGEDYDPGSGGPSVAEIDRWLRACGEGGGVSGGWLGLDGRGSMALAVGETNEEGREGEFPGVCTAPERGDHLPVEARWMWFDRDTEDGRSAFQSSGGPGGEFLIFRIAVEEILSGGP